MKRSNHLIIFILAIVFLSCSNEKKENEWIELFNGKDLTGWEANETEESFKVVDGMIVANGQRSHLLYVGDKKEPVRFKNFELSADVMTHHLANSGIYFHTAYQEEGWLSQGYEVQINATHRGGGGYKEVKKGGSLYGIRNLYKAYVPDSVWYNLNIRVEGKRIRIKMNDQLLVDYTEPPISPDNETKQRISSGTFALQGHDPESTVFFKNIKVKVLDDTPEDSNVPEKGAVFPKMMGYQANHFAFIDMHIDADESFSIDSAMNQFYLTGVNPGLVADISRYEEGKAEEALSDHIKNYSKYPVFLGIYRKNLSSLENISSSTLDQFDYVIGDLTTFKNRKGEETDILNEKNIGSKEAFMDDYVKAITEALDKGGLNIWSSATILPASLATEYDQLWTPERMDKVIDALKRNNVAIEVNNKTQLPGISFLKLAKEKGCLFTIGSLYTNEGMQEPTYFYEVIDQCKLDYKDIYIPGNSN